MIQPFALMALLAQEPSPAPPSTVLVPGGRTRIGLEVREVERMVIEDPEAAQFAGSLIAETPRQDVAVESFWMMVTEVTQEQFGVFVRATGALPLESWCERALTEAALEFARQEELAAPAGDEPRPKRTFDRRAWWQQNAARVAWEIPAADRLRPVVFVDHATARAFARWAGMRLPSEFEYQRAVRGDGTQIFPWGNEWDDERYAATQHARKKGGTFPVGSFPAGRSRLGIFDLAGNVWEWTSSPFVKYPGYELRVIEVGYGRERRPVNAIATFDPEQRVVVGGSYQTSRLMCRASVRRGTERKQSAGGLGFRCAASTRPGLDLASYVLDDDFPPYLRPEVDGARIEYDAAAAVCVDGWSSATNPAAPERYAIVEDYRYVLFVPVERLPVGDPGTFERKSLETPLPLGILATNVPLAEPALDAGSYRIAYRARGVRKLGDPRASAAQFGKAPLEETLRIDVSRDHLIVSDLRGTPLLAVPASVVYGPERANGLRASPSPDGRGRVLDLDVSIPSRTTNKGFGLTLRLCTSALEREPAWRR